MNKKKYQIGVKKIAKTLFILALMISTVRVFAESPGDSQREKESEKLYSDSCASDYDDAKDVEKCKKAAASCYTKLKGEFPFKLRSDDNDNFTLSIENDTSKTVKFRVKYKLTINGAGQPEVSKEVEIKAGKQYKETFATNWNESTTVIIDANAELISDFTATAEIDGKNENVNCSGKYFAVANTEISATKKDTFDNPDYYEIQGSKCYKYLNGTLTKSEVGNYTDLIDKYSYNSIKGLSTPNGTGDVAFKKTMTYCFNKTISKRDNSLIKNIYKAAKSIYNSKQSSETTNQMDPLIPGSVEVKNLKNAINLTCDAVGKLDSSTGNYISEGNVRSFYHYLEPIKKSIKYNYNYNNPTTVDICEVNCREDLTITYGPPVAVMAGFCFEYEVKVESKVTCDSKIYENGAPEIEKYQVCEPTPHCNNGYSQAEYQAGPNEEFDECIYKTDGGKYTQKAINSCYEKVYGKSKKQTKTKTNLALNYENVERMANGISECNPANANTSSSWWNVYNAYNSGGYYGGYYTPSGGLHWEKYTKGPYYADKDKTEEIPVMDNCHWNGYARFYFNNTINAQRVVQNDAESGYRYDGWDRYWVWEYSPSVGPPTRRNVPAGIKDGKVIGGDWCTDTCWYTSSCNGKYYNQVAPYDVVGDNSTHLSAEAQYNLDYNDYLAAVESCSAAAKCDTTTATYKMTINNLEGTSKICEVGQDDDNCTSWTDTGKSKNQCEYNTKNPSENGITAPLSTGDSKKTSIVPTDKVKSKCNDIGSGSLLTYNDTSIREISGVCAGVPGDNQHYRTIIGFPGSWLYIKNYKYYYHNPKDMTNYEFVPGKYCVGNDIHTVNKAWWNWDQVDQRSSTKVSNLNTETKTDAGGKQITVLKNGKYNIKAFVETFGKAHWKFNISCFYAAVEEEPPGGICEDNKCCYSEDDECCGETCPPDDKGGPLDYTTKAAALDDLFPATENTSSAGKTSSKTIESVAPTKLNMISTENSDSKSNLLKVENSAVASRSTGYNWTCNSSTLFIKNYPIAPTALIAKIQTKYEKADSVYNDKSELDFAFRITPEQIKAIRKSNSSKSRKSNPYAIVGKNHYKNNDNDINFYKSSLLGNSNYVTDIAEKKGAAKSRNKVNHTCNNMINGKCDNLSEYINKVKATCKNLNE